MGAADKGKKPKIASSEEDSEELDIIDANLILSIDKLQDLQQQLDKVNEEACEKVLEVEQKYNEIRKPVYTKRKELIKGIPDFWSIAFVHHPYIYDLLRAEDQEVFRYLSSLEVEDFNNVDSGYSITFNFKPNPYFEDTELSKTFVYPEDELTLVTGTTIKWKEGMDIITASDHERKGRKRPYVDDRQSFFCWFSETKPNTTEDVFHDEVMHCLLTSSLFYLDDLLDQDVADIIKEELWPNPLKYFNYGADDDDVEDDDDGDCEDDDESEEDDEDVVDVCEDDDDN
ncbi:hypothetical protein IFM89_028347 [Coptis chinensis]|uniref:Uncharacterized protein n=1 Tax=Coptis chinensis TaxID=261450 RepID=A0A835MJI1_9MAGN|nr:hypothetical protein IFM89_028347 [Coptis chinensis]